jgi:hypothetical protein
MPRRGDYFKPSGAFATLALGSYAIHAHKRRAMPNLLEYPARLMRNPQVREFFLFCAPGLFIGLLIRAWMTVQMPCGYVQYDSADFLSTARHLLHDGDFWLNNKRTFLVPLLYTVPFLVKIPALYLIPLAQHLLGLLTVGMAGVLVRLWFESWRWFIVPVTLLTACNPAMLWYEHALMAESIYLFCAFTVAVAGTCFARTRSNASFVWLLVSLFLTAAARPEGKIYFLLALLLVPLKFWGDWRKLAVCTGLVGVVLVGVTLLTGRGQSGQLLLASVVPFAPDHSKAFPDASADIRALRDKALATYPALAPTNLTVFEKKAAKLALNYFKTHPEENPDVSAFCQKIAMESILNQPFVLPLLALNKFRLTLDRNTCVGYDRSDHRATVGKQIQNFTRKKLFFHLSKGLTGREIKTSEEAELFFRSRFSAERMRWFGGFQHAWRRLTLGARLPATHLGERTVPGMPLFFLLAFGGLLAGIFGSGPMRTFHLSWLVMFAALWFGVMLTGVVNPRYRFVFEPFCAIYVFLLLDVLAGVCRWITTSGRDCSERGEQTF